MAETAAISALTTQDIMVKERQEARREKKRAYMAERYMDPEFRAAKKADMLRRYHLRVPEARYGTRGRRPARVDLEESALSGASTPRVSDLSDFPAAAVVLTGAALGAALAAIL
jgi:hypothetical protein